VLFRSVGVVEDDLVQIHVHLFRKAQPAPATNDDQPRRRNKKESDADFHSDDEDLFKKQQEQRQKMKRKRDLPPVHVHAPMFPDKKFERWVVVLVDEKGKVMDMKKVPSLAEDVELTFMVLAQKGTTTYQVHAMCDSYIDCDVSTEVRLSVDSKGKEREQEKIALRDDDDRAEKDDDELAEEPVSFWYNVFDKVATVVLLGIILFGGYMYLSQKEWFVRIVQPRIDSLLVLLNPVTSRLAVVLGPFFGWWERTIAPLLHVETQPVKVDPSKYAKFGQQSPY